MANWFRLCENRHTDRHRQLRIAQGPLPPHLFPPLSLPPSCPLISTSPPLPPHTPLLQVEEASFIPPFCPLFLLGSLLSSFRPSWVLLLAVSVWTVAVGGWRIALSERARAGPTCSACSDMDSEYSISDHSPPSRTDLSRDCLCYCLSFHACTWLCHFVKLKDMFMYCTSAKRLQCRRTKSHRLNGLFKHTWAQYYRVPTQHTHAQKKKKALFQVRLCSRLLCFCSERSRRSRCASLCQCYRLDFPSRGCVSYLPYFASFVFFY